MSGLGRWTAGLALGALAVCCGASAASAQTITTVAGSGLSGFSGDSGPAAAARLNGPRGVSFMPDGGFVFADFWNGRVRRVFPGGRIATVAGQSKEGFRGDGGQALDARLSKIHDVAGMPDGGFMVADEGNNRIRRVYPSGIIRTVAGFSGAGFEGDGGLATKARLRHPRGFAATGRGGFLIADSDNNRIRCVTDAGVITTVAGNGGSNFSGDRGRATRAQLGQPFDVAPTYDGGFLVADRGNNRVRKVYASGVIKTVAGNGATPDPNSNGLPAAGDGGKATSTSVRPWSVAAMPDGGFLLADAITDRVRRVLPNGTITTAAGNGLQTSIGDGGPAPMAGIFGPRSLAVRGDGAFLIAEFGPDAESGPGGDRVRFVGSNPFAAAALARFASDCNYTPIGLRVAKRLKARSGRAFRIRYRLGRSAKVTVTIKKGSRRVFRKRVASKSGRHALRVRKALGAGRYKVTVTASGAHQKARTSSRLTVKS